MSGRSRKRILLGLAAFGVFLVALIPANLWIFHGWAASGPPSQRPEWHHAWSLRFLWITCAMLVLALVLAVRAWKAGSRRAAADLLALKTRGGPPPHHL